METKEPGTMSADLVELLGRRYNFLAVLDTETYEKRTLQEKLGVSRSTVDRAVRELQTANLVARVDHGYRTTLYGYTLLAIYESILDNVERVRRAKTILSMLPPDVDFTIDLLMDADVHLAEEPATHVPRTELNELVERAANLKVIAYAHTAPRANDIFYNQIVNNGTGAELVFRQKMYSYLESTYSDQLRDLLKEDQCSIYVTNEIPYGLLVATIDGTEYVALIVYGMQDSLRGVIVNNNPNAVRWANETFNHYRETATRVNEI